MSLHRTVGEGEGRVMSRADRDLMDEVVPTA